MHATRARLPQKRTASKKPAAKKSLAKKALKLETLPVGVTSLAAHRALQPQRVPSGVEIYAKVEWIAPARESWRRGELEVRRTACMPMTATRVTDGALTLTDLPGQGDALQIDCATVNALISGTMAKVTLTLPGLRVTLTAEDLVPALPLPRETGRVLPFPKRA